MTHAIDVVVPTRDRFASLVGCLEALAEQTFQDFAITVLDDGSRTPVAAALPEELRDRLHISILRHPVSQGPAAARNAAIAAGSAPCIAFVDDDVRAAPDFLERHIALLEDHGGEAIIFGPLAAPPDWRPTPWNEWEAAQVEAEYGRMSRGEYHPTWRQFHTGNAFLARQAFEDAGGFNEAFTRAEDVEFALRAALRGYRVAFNPDAVGWHYSYRTFESWRRIPRAYAEFDLRLDQLYPGVRWGQIVERERGLRHPAIRGARAALAVPGFRRSVAAAARCGSRALRSMGSRAGARGLLSVCYDLEYEESRRAALRSPAFARPSVPSEPVSAPRGRR